MWNIYFMFTLKDYLIFLHLIHLLHCAVEQLQLLCRFPTVGCFKVLLFPQESALIHYSSRCCRAGCLMWYFRATVCWSSLWLATFTAAALFLHPALQEAPLIPFSVTTVTLKSSRSQPGRVVASPETHWVTLFFWFDSTVHTTAARFHSTWVHHRHICVGVFLPCRLFEHHSKCVCTSAATNSTDTQQISSYCAFSKKRHRDYWQEQHFLKKAAA